MQRLRVASFLALGLGALIAACGTEVPGPLPQCVTSPTYAKDIKALSDRACVRCHDQDKVNMARQGAPLGLDFNTFELIADKSKFADAITSGREPPMNTMPAIEITAEERALVSNWRICGYLP